MNFTPEEIRLALLGVLILIVSVAFHEYGHAKMADLLGDDTPRRQGRVTLNPLAHADPIGTVLLPLLMSVTGVGLGWGKPVQWQPSRINRKWGMTTAQILVAVAGPAMNVVLAVIGTTAHVLLLHFHVMDPDSFATQVLYNAVATNFVLFFFNLLPLPPLDGGHVAQGLTPYRYREKFDHFARYAPFILLAIIAIPRSPLGNIFRIPATWCTDHLYSLLISLFG